MSYKTLYDIQCFVKRHIDTHAIFRWCVLSCSCPPILGRLIGHCMCSGPSLLCVKCVLCTKSGRCVKGRRRRMRWRPWFLVRHVCLELRRLMPAGWPCQVGPGLLGLFASTFFRPFSTICFFLSFFLFRNYFYNFHFFNEPDFCPWDLRLVPSKNPES